MTTAQKVRLPGAVSCDACNTPALRVVGTTVVIEHVHHGSKHVTVLTLQQILDKMEPSGSV